MPDHSYFANLIWQIADLLRGPYRPPQYERVMLPMTAAFNVLLVRHSGGRGFWAWFLAGNLHLVPGLTVL